MQHTLGTRQLRTMTLVRLRPWGLGVTGALITMLATATPCLAQVDFSGEWAGTFYEDLAASRRHAAWRLHRSAAQRGGLAQGRSWDEAARSHARAPVHPARRDLRAARPGHHPVVEVVEPDSGRLIAYSLMGSYGRPRMIWMDGRPHPSDLAPHTWAGFSTGRGSETRWSCRPRTSRWVGSSATERRRATSRR